MQENFPLKHLPPVELTLKRQPFGLFAIPFFPTKSTLSNDFKPFYTLFLIPAT